MEEQSEKALMRNLHKEQERERRRLRDRQRRQSMSVEEREKHLARRRRNYQLRRQQAGVAYLDLQPNQSIASKDEILMPTTDECCEMISSPSVTIQCNGLAQVSTDQRQQMLSADLKNSVALEIPAHMFSQLPMRPLLNHIKHLARSLHDPVGVVTNHKIAAELILQGNAASNCIPPKKLRLNHVKHIARALNSEVVKTEDAGDESKMEVVKNMLEEPKTFSANIEMSLLLVCLMCGSFNPVVKNMLEEPKTFSANTDSPTRQVNLHHKHKIEIALQFSCIQVLSGVKKSKEKGSNASAERTWMLDRMKLDEFSKA